MANEVGALIEVAAEAADRLAITPAQSLHRAVAARVFGSVGPLSAPVRIVHDGVAGAVYQAVRGATMGGAAMAAAAARGILGTDCAPLSRSRRGRDAVAAINALIGDRLLERGNQLAIPMTLRYQPADVSSRVVVFLHGLAESDEWWEQGGFGRRLSAELALTPVYVRYNTGLPVLENGRRLAELLGTLVDGWPLPVESIDLVGHSMGGLVARAASASVPRLRHLVTLGTPHGGAPLPKAVHAAAWLLARVPEARPLAEVLDARSAGIRDLRRGLAGVPLDAACTHTFIAATVTPNPAHPLGWAVGDLLVRLESASGRHRRRPLEPDAAIHLGPLTHFDLLSHPSVYERVRAALSG